MYVELYRPQAKVTFLTESGNLVARATNNPNSTLDDDVVSISTVRDMQADSPTFTIQLTRRKPWHKYVTSNDLVIIEMCRPPEKLARVFIGLVDDCRKRAATSGNTVQRVITVQGRGIAKGFIRFDVGVVPEAEYASTSVGWLEAAGITLAGSTPSKIADGIWETIARKHIEYKFSDGSTLFDYTVRNFADRPDIMLLDSSTIMNWQGSINSLLKDVAEDPFYEVFWEMDDKYDSLFLRPTPFNKTEWDALPSVNISDVDVVSEDLGRSDVETYSIYSVGAKTLFSPQDTYKTFGVLPYWNKEYAKKYGNARLHVETSYTSVTSSDDVELQTDTMASLMKDLYNWNIMNNSFINGTIIVKGGNKYKVGTKLYYTSQEEGWSYEFYITSVTHDFVNYGTYTTTLGVTRGMNPTSRFSAPWDTYAEYSGLGILPFDPEGARSAMELDGSNSSSGSPDGIDFTSANKVVAGAKDVMNNGINHVKVRYVFGGNSPQTGALDCSSFTQYVYRMYAGGLDLGRTTGQQVTKGSKVEKADLLPGDLVFFKGTYNSGHIYGVSHVGIYIGNNQFINNSSTKNGLVVGDLNETYWVDHWLMGRRVLTSTQLNDNGGGGNDGTRPSGKPIAYTASAYGATALNLEGGPGWIPTFKTAIGTTPKEGQTIAVDKRKIPLYSKVYIECPTYPSVNGEYIAEDVGGAIKGNRIDIYFDDIPPKDAHAARKRMLAFGMRDINVWVTRKGKG